MANDINIGSLLFDVGADPAQVKRFTNELRQVGRDAQRSFESAGKAAHPVSNRLRELNERIRTLTAQQKAGLITSDQFRQRMGQLRQEFEKVERQGLSTQKQIGDFARGMDKVQSALRPTSNAARDFRSRLNLLKAEFEQGTISEREFVAASQKLRGEIRQQIAVTDKAGKEYGQLVNVLGTTTRSINSAEGKMSKLGISAQIGIALNQQFAGSLMAMGPAGQVAAMGITAANGSMGELKASTIATVAVVGGLGIAAWSLTRRGIPEVKEMQKALAVLEASGVENLEGIRDALDEVREAGGSASRMFSRADLATSLAETVKAGVEANDALTLLATGTQLAAAEGTNLTESTALLLANLRQFRLDATDAARAGDALAQAGLLAASTAGDLSKGLSTVGPVARAAGLTLEETLGILVDLDNNGLEAAERGATALRTTLATLADPTAEARETLAGLGVTLENTEGKARPILDVLFDLSEALKGNEEAAQAAAKIFDTRAVTAILAISDATHGYTTEIEQATGALDAYAGTLTDDELEAAQARLDASLDNLSLTFTATFAGNIASAADHIARLFDAIDQAGRDPNFFSVLRALQRSLGVDPTLYFEEPDYGSSGTGEGPGIVTAPGMVFGADGVTTSTGGDLGTAPPAGVQAVGWDAAIAKARELQAAVENAANPQAWVAARDALAAWSAESDTNKDALQALQEFERRAAEAAREREQAHREAERAAEQAAREAERAAEALEKLDALASQQAVALRRSRAQFVSDSRFGTPELQATYTRQLELQGGALDLLGTQGGVNVRTRSSTAALDAMRGETAGEQAVRRAQLEYQQSLTRAADMATAQAMANSAALQQLIRSAGAGRFDTEAEREAFTRQAELKGGAVDLLTAQGSANLRSTPHPELARRALAHEASLNAALISGFRAAAGTAYESGAFAEFDPIDSSPLTRAERDAARRTSAMSRFRTGEGSTLTEGFDLAAENAREAEAAIESVEEQIARLSGNAPTQFDQMRAAVEEFGIASGMSETEIAGLIEEINKLEQQDKLISTLNDISGALKSLGGAAAGTPLGDALTGMSEMVDVATKFASGDILGGVTAVLTEFVAGFTAASKAAQKLEEDLEGIQSGFDLIDTDELVKTTREKVGQFFFIPIYGEVVDEAATELGLSVAEALEGGVLNGLRRGFEAYLDSHDREDLEDALREGFRSAIIDAIFEALVEGALVEGALGQYLTDLTRAIAEGDTGAANAAIEAINATIPGLADMVADYAGRINIPDPVGAEVTGGSALPDSSTPTGISIPVAPNPVLAAPAWVPEFVGAIDVLSGAANKFDRAVDRLGTSSIAGDLLRSN